MIHERISGLRHTVSFSCVNVFKIRCYFNAVDSVGELGELCSMELSFTLGKSFCKAPERPRYVLKSILPRNWTGKSRLTAEII